MQGSETDITLLVLITGVILVAAALIKLVLERLKIPPVVGFILFGLCLNLLNARMDFLGPGAVETLRYLSGIGIICLLFRAGLECDLIGLVNQLRRASIIWLVDMTFSGMVGYWTTRYLLGYALVPSLIIGVAMTATSVGISLAVWQHQKATDSDNGRLLLDIAELDDISAVILMAMLFTLIPLLVNGHPDQLWVVLSRTSLVFAVKLSAFVALCYCFATLAEHPIVEFFRKFDPPPLPMLTVMGIGLIIAAIAGFLDFSVAIGAFFAGLVFSRDQKAVKMEASFLPLYEFFTPFFFIIIGFDIEITSLGRSIPLALILFGAAVIGKMLANGVPLWMLKNLPAALLVGASMVPRAEIAMVVMQKGAQLGRDVLPSELFSGMALVSIATCALTPLIVRPLLQRWPQK